MSQGKANPFNVPASWPAAFTQEDREAAERIIGWLNAREQTRSWLCRASRLSAATTSQVLSGRYPSSPTKHLRAMEAAIETQNHREESGTGGTGSYVETGIYKLVAVACDRARYNASFAIVTGYVGVGKTAAVKRYANSHPHTHVLEANPNMSAGVLLTDLLTILHAEVPRSLDAKFAKVVEALTTSDLLIIDEAETMQPRCLHYLRRIRDKAGVGIVLTGTERLKALIRPAHGAFDQIRSRVCFWPANIQAISRDDANAIARAALRATGAVKVAPEALDALWQYCEGSARMLTENLIPALRDYGIAKGHTLTAQLVDAVAQKALLLPPRKINRENAA